MKPRIKFCFESGCDPFWSDNDLSRQLYEDYYICIDKLKLSEKTVEQLEIVIGLEGFYLNPLYQCFPSFWREKLCVYFNQLAEEVYQSTCADLKDKIEVVKGFGEIEEDERLAFFLTNPVEYCLQNEISFGDPDKLIAEVEEQNKIYLKFEKFILSGKFERAFLSG